MSWLADLQGDPFFSDAIEVQNDDAPVAAILEVVLVQCLPSKID